MFLGSEVFLFFVWVGGIYNRPRVSPGLPAREAEWRGCWEKLCLRVEKGWALEVSQSDTGHMIQAPAEATRGTARGHNTQELGTAGASIAGGKTNK